jgi:hypothetical protein
MGRKFTVFANIFQIITGLAAVASFVILSLGNEDMKKWIPTLILAVGFFVIGVLGLINGRTDK